MKITMTEKAQAYLRKELAAQGGYLRISVAPGGCSGMMYQASIVEHLGDDDEVVHEEGGIRIVSDSFSKYFLSGLVIDFSDDLIKPGLSLTNVHATQACGCGASFAL